MPFDFKHVPIWTGNDLASLEVPKDYFLIGPPRELNEKTEDGLLPRGSHAVLGGLTGIGKTFILMNMTRAFMNGSAIFNLPEWTCHKSRVLYVEKELGHYMFGKRLRDMFAPGELPEFGERFRIMSKPRDFYFDNPDVVAGLQQYCNGEGIDVLMLDPITRFLINEGESNEGARIVDALERISDGKVAILVTHHFRKPLTGRDAENYDVHSHYNFRGTIGTRLVEDASFTLTLDKFDEQKTPYFRWKLSAHIDKVRHAGNSRPDFELTLNWEDDRRVEHYEKPGRRLIEPFKPTGGFQFPSTD